VISLTLAALAQAGGPAGISRGQWPDYVVMATNAVAKHNVSVIQSTFSEIKEVPFDGDHSVPISAGDALKLLSGCTQSDVGQLHGATYGQVQVDKSGASATYRCSNATLTGLYAVDFDFIGQRLWRVWIQTPESRAKMNSAGSERGN